MQHSRPRLLFIVAFGLACLTASRAAEAGSPGRPPGSVSAGPDQAALDRAAQAFADSTGFMGSVLVARDGAVLLSKGYGLANVEWEIRNTPSTKFRLGSLTKQFTAAAILLLEERGLLKVTDPVKQYVPDAPAGWDHITIFHLLTHTSGIPNFTGFPDYVATKVKSVTPANLVARFRDKPLDFTPGEKWAYSNSGYVLLGYIIERVSHQTYADFLQQNIFQPLSLSSSGYDTASQIIPARASGYEQAGETRQNASFIDMSVPFSAGGIYSTTEDLARWVQGLFGGKLLSPAALTRMTTPFKNDYALGLIVATQSGRQVVTHAGGIDGFSTFLLYYPDERLTVAVLANLAYAKSAALGQTLAAIVHGEPVPGGAARKAIVLPAATLQKYVGVYEFNPKFALTITATGASLTAQATGQSPFALQAEAENKFFVTLIDAQLEFQTDAQGVVTGVVLRQNGQSNSGRKR